MYFTFHILSHIFWCSDAILSSHTSFKAALRKLDCGRVLKVDLLLQMRTLPKYRQPISDVNPTRNCAESSGCK